MDNKFEQMIRVIKALEEFYTPSEALTYMVSSHPLLDDKTPISLIEQGKWEDVMRIIQQMSEGVYL